METAITAVLIAFVVVDGIALAIAAIAMVGSKYRG